MLVVIFAYCYGHIFHTIRRQSRVIGSHRASIATTSRGQNIELAQPQQQAATAATTAGRGQGNLSQLEMNILKTMLAVIGCFLICWTPPEGLRLFNLLGVSAVSSPLSFIPCSNKTDASGVAV